MNVTVPPLPVTGGIGVKPAFGSVKPLAALLLYAPQAIASSPGWNRTPLPLKTSGLAVTAAAPLVASSVTVGPGGVHVIIRPLRREAVLFVWAGMTSVGRIARVDCRK